MTTTPTAALRSEHAHESAAIEWWFVQGYYDTAAGRRWFMTTLFRYDLAPDGDPPSSGFQTLVTVLDPATDRQHRSETRVDSRSVGEAARRVPEATSGLDAVVLAAVKEGLTSDGPPRPIILDEEPARFSGDPFDLVWGEFAMAQRDGALALTFREPGTGTPVSLSLEPLAPLLDVALDTPTGGSGMTYRCYPRARVSGRCGTASVTGEAWLDHQWGDTAWIWDARTETLLGWDWFGINLEDGSDWVVIRHRVAESGTPVALNATVRHADGGETACTDVRLTPIRHWESPRTWIRYPVAWRIEIPSLDADLTFEPLADAQEVSSFGLLRAVWEGAGRVTGRVGDRDVRGRGRGEFHGYGYIFDYHEFLGAMGRRVDRRLEELLPRRFDAESVERFIGPGPHDEAAATGTLATPVWDLIDRSGKRWRPVFGQLLLEALGVESGPYERLGAAMTELIHTGALIVDDIEDASAVRRGQEAIHLRYGVDVALNAANALYFLPSVELARHPLLSSDQRLRLFEIKDRVCIEAHFGQAMDIHWSRTLTRARLREWMADDMEAKLLRMYDLKTGAGARGLAETCTVVAEADAELTAACVDFAGAFAVAFQLMDDVHNFSRSPRWTKVTGEDIANGKPTYAIVSALRRLPGARRERLEAILCSPERRADPVALDEAIGLVHESGALDACQRLARDRLTAAWSRFAPDLGPSEPKIMLHALCLKLIDLSYDA